MVASAKGRRAQGVGGAASKWKLDAHSKITQVDKSDNFVATKTGQHTDTHTHTDTLKCLRLELGLEVELKLEMERLRLRLCPVLSLAA